jgi:transaldolase/glucose-6-phosphate isomerase
VDRELLSAPEHYGRDRVFAYLRLDSAPDLTQDARIAVLEQAGHPVIRVHIAEPYDLAQEFFRWEFATAVAGSVLGINPFNQPDVEASKQETRKLTSEYEQSGSLPEEKPFFQADGVQLFADPRNANSIREIAHRSVGPGQVSLAAYLKAHLSQLRSGDYFALLAYLEMNEANEKVLQAIRHLVRDRTRVATCVGFGPRFLHSTGQAYKGGPNTGVFLQITCADAADLEIPGQKFSFGVVKAAQARGDFQVLADRGRRALRVHLASGARSGLEALQSAALAALA